MPHLLCMSEMNALQLLPLTEKLNVLNTLKSVRRLYVAGTWGSGALIVTATIK